MSSSPRPSLASRSSSYKAFTTLVPLIAMAAAPAGAQQAEAIRYEIHSAAGGLASSDELPGPGERRTRQVIHGPDLMLVFPGDAQPRVENAIYYDGPAVGGEPVAPNGSLGVLGPAWAELRAQDIRYDTFEVDVRRGEQDREIEGRTAHHYILETRILRQRETWTRKERFDITADLWIIEDLPYSHAPFSFGGTSALTAMAPRLRSELRRELEPLGLVARSEISIGFQMLEESAEGFEVAGGSNHSSFVFVTDLEPSEPPQRPPLPVVAADFEERVQSALQSDPGGFCMQVREGTAPAVVRETIGEEHRPTVVARMEQACGGQPLMRAFFVMIRPQLQEDGAGFCERVGGAADPAEFADEAFSDENAEAFLQLFSPEEQESFVGEIERVCERYRRS